MLRYAEWWAYKKAAALWRRNGRLVHVERTLPLASGPLAEVGADKPPPSVLKLPPMSLYVNVSAPRLTDEICHGFSPFRQSRTEPATLGARCARVGGRSIQEPVPQGELAGTAIVAVE